MGMAGSVGAWRSGPRGFELRPFFDLTWAVRGIWLVVGFLWIVWLGVEDRGVLAVLLLSTAISFASSLTGLDRWASGKRLSGRQWWGRWLLMGLVWALAIGPLAILLIAVKTSLHAHGVPDFSMSSLREVIDVWPAWGAGAFLVSLGFGFLGRARLQQTNA